MLNFYGIRIIMVKSGRLVDESLYLATETLTTNGI